MRNLITLSVFFIISISNFMVHGQNTSPSINSDNIKFGADLQLRKPSFIGSIYLECLTPSYAPSILFRNSDNTNFGSLGRNNGAIKELNWFTISAYNNFSFQTLNSDWLTRLFIKKTGEVGIGTETPTSQLEVNGFTKLGSDAPAIKIKKLTSGCTTSANSGYPNGEITVTHGVTPAKILKVEALVEYNTNYWVKDGNDLFGYQFDVYVTNSTISLRNFSGSASSEIRSKPCKILITYEE